MARYLLLITAALALGFLAFDSEPCPCPSMQGSSQPAVSVGAVNIVAGAATVAERRRVANDERAARSAHEAFRNRSVEATASRATPCHGPRVVEITQTDENVALGEAIQIAIRDGSIQRIDSSTTRGCECPHADSGEGCGCGCAMGGSAGHSERHIVALPTERTQEVATSTTTVREIPRCPMLARERIPEAERAHAGMTTESPPGSQQSDTRIHLQQQVIRR